MTSGINPVLDLRVPINPTVALSPERVKEFGGNICLDFLELGFELVE